MSSKSAEQLWRRAITRSSTLRRILVAEDSALVAMDIELMLQEFGCEVLGPVARLERAMEMAEADSFDGAIIDVELQDQTAFPLADKLVARGIPFVFATGFGEEQPFPPPYDRYPRLQKPFDESRLREVILAFTGSDTDSG